MSAVPRAVGGVGGVDPGDATTAPAPWDDGRNREGEVSALGGADRGHVFVRSHFPVPDLDVTGYALTVSGAVTAPLRLTFDDLVGLADQDRVVATECAGNGRGLAPTFVPGVQWTGAAVGRARWTGVTLARLLEVAGADRGARRVLLGGADAGPLPSGETVAFERGLPMSKAADGTVLVATAMDGEPIPAEHGGPVRAVVPGWYGVASIKWLTSITVETEDRYTHWETVDYSLRTVDAAGNVGTVPLTAMQPKAQITSPQRGATIAAGRTTVHGLAWAGERAVASVEVSADGGASWHPATLLDEPAAYDWVRWQSSWEARPGRHGLLVRCTDDAGAIQPADRDPDRGHYLFNELTPHPVTVRADRKTDASR